MEWLLKPARLCSEILCRRDEAAQKTAFLTALTTEHFVLQTAASSTIVAGRSPPSRWSCSNAFGAVTNVGSAALKGPPAGRTESCEKESAVLIARP